MSKKILKRSLALGALMAFVITGSAMAADVEFNNFVNGATAGKVISVTEDTVVKADASTQSLHEYTLNVGDGVNLTLNEIGRAGYDGGVRNVTGNGNVTIVNTKPGVALDSEGTIYVKNLTVIANDDNTSTRYDSAKKGGSTTIVAKEDVYFHTGDHAIHTEGGNVAISARNVTIETEKGDNGRSIINSNGGSVDIDATGDVKINSSILGFDGVGGITIDAKNIIIDSYTDGVLNQANALIKLNATNDLTIKGEGRYGAVYVTETEEKCGIELSAGGNTVIEGDVNNDGVGYINASFSGEKSYLKGAAENSGNGKINFVFNEGATWEVTDRSNVSEIGGNDAKIKVKDAVKAEGWVQVDKVSATKLTVATETDDSKTQETLDALAKVAVTKDEAGNEVAAATQVQLKNAIYDNVVGNVTDEGVKISEKEVAAANVSVNDMVAVGMMSWRAEMNDMNKRMGELRNANGEHGVWVRMVRGESEYNSVKNQYNQYQLGYDEKLSVDKRWTVGVALSYTDAENNFAQGTGESTNKALSVYGSKLNDDGTFIDLIAKYARLENDFTVQGGQGDADYDTNAYSFSAEVGKRIQQGKGLWIEPQVELTYGKVSAVDYVTKNDVRVAQDGMESLVGRVGFSLGKDIEKGNVYARASYLYDFDGETKATLNNDAVLENDLGGGWWEVGVGANINLSKATYIYADIEKTFGGEVDTNWQWNLGVRYSF